MTDTQTQTPSPRAELDQLITEYASLKPLDSAATIERLSQIRGEVSQLRHLMGPQERDAWTLLRTPSPAVADPRCRGPRCDTSVKAAGDYCDRCRTLNECGACGRGIPAGTEYCDTCLDNCRCSLCNEPE